jgi:hypothetical protein
MERRRYLTSRALRIAALLAKRLRSATFGIIAIERKDASSSKLLLSKLLLTYTKLRIALPSFMQYHAEHW